ncbi:YbaN family protein [Roseovarius salinarum]|uniref:YbaN family protein n=1 Tax=Roseovarius salinarum TaxID=1981892 RepID=UPI000C323258|nr:YbaN family protein [Roseovarius salinarum]
MYILWLLLGLLSLGLGLLGVVVPLLPTVPFILLAAFCFARSSARLHNWLVRHPRFGAVIADWRDHGAISLRGKRLATLGIVAVAVISFVSGVAAYIILIQLVVLSLVLLFIWTRPHGPR